MLGSIDFWVCNTSGVSTQHTGRRLRKRTKCEALNLLNLLLVVLACSLKTACNDPGFRSDGQYSALSLLDLSCCSVTPACVSFGARKLQSMSSLSPPVRPFQLFVRGGWVGRCPSDETPRLSHPCGLGCVVLLCFCCAVSNTLRFACRASNSSFRVFLKDSHDEEEAARVAQLSKAEADAKRREESMAAAAAEAAASAAAQPPPVRIFVFGAPRRTDAGEALGGGDMKMITVCSLFFPTGTCGGVCAFSVLHFDCS